MKKATSGRPRISIFSSGMFATYPYYSDAVWYLSQMRRWGQINEAKDDDWFAETAKKVYRPDIYLKAARSLVDGRPGEGRRIFPGTRMAIARRRVNLSMASPMTGASRMII